ncbi:MAG: hypothetical protein M3Y82_06825 [Verrucomicrobiota bacterium]|nr:hypothetical protein [Verrucomicrobiota bacterium]
MKLILIILICVCVGLFAGIFFLYSSNQKKDAELILLRQQNQEVESLRSELERLKAFQVDSNEVARLRQENQEIYKLRNEVAQLNKQKQSPQNQPVAAGQFPAPNAFSPEQVQQLLKENQQLRSEHEEFRVAGNAATQQGCIANLKQLEVAKTMWAVNNKKSGGVEVTANDIAPFLKAAPACPSGGTYTLNPVGVEPSCSVPGHSLSP